MTDNRDCGWLGCGNDMCESVCAGIAPSDTVPAYLCDVEDAE